MAMTKCRECGKDVSSSARRCPQCGADDPDKTGYYVSFAITLGIIAFVIWIAYLR